MNRFRLFSSVITNLNTQLNQAVNYSLAVHVYQRDSAANKGDASTFEHRSVKKLGGE
jgi:hypothetical protein